jgi:putative redox protein
MAERMIVKQDRNFRTTFQVADPEDIHSDNYEPVETIHQLTPYGMLLGSLASCTALVLHTFAQNHDIPLNEVELHMFYQRVFREDCENCDEDRKFTEEFEQKILLVGDISAADRLKLLQVAHLCPVHKIIKGTMLIKTSLIEATLSDD